MSTYSAADVERLVGLTAATLRALVKAGFVAPTRVKRELRFSFQDLIVLRTAQSLSQARVPATRITRALKALREQLPDSMPLSGLSIGAVGDQVVVREGASRRRADTGQYLLGFEGDPARGDLRVLERPAPAGPRPAVPDEDLFARAVSLEEEDPDAAIDLYAQAIAREPARVDARVNLGRLLHERGDLASAAKVYRDALAACGGDALLQFNLAVALEDLGKPHEALAAYRAALEHDPVMADAHCNLALLCESLGQQQEAIRHFAQYRRLTGAAAG